MLARMATRAPNTGDQLRLPLRGESIARLGCGSGSSVQLSRMEGFGGLIVPAEDVSEEEPEPACSELGPSESAAMGLSRRGGTDGEKSEEVLEKASEGLCSRARPSAVAMSRPGVISRLALHGMEALAGVMTEVSCWISFRDSSRRTEVSSLFGAWRPDIFARFCVFTVDMESY